MDKRTEYKSVAFVPEDNMCTGCGVCAAICPIDDCIEMFIDKRKGVYQASVNLDTCTDCTICIKACPPITWSNIPKTELYNEHVGDYLSSCAAYSNDLNVRKDSASGGFITSLLIYLLETRLIEGALVVKRDENNPLISVPFIATTIEEIKNAKGSKYSPVKYDDVIREIISNNYSNLAIVGLPCHIEAIAKASTRRIKKLKKKIKYKISIVCGQSPSFVGYNYIANRLNINTDDIIDIENRGGGWPGYMTITTRNKEVKVPYGSKYSMGMVLSSPIFTPLSCQMCADAVGFEGDVSVADAWLEKYMDDTKGVNMVLIKNQEMRDIIDRMYEDNVISVFEENVDSFIQANRSVIYSKSKYNKYRLDGYIKNNRRYYSKGMVSTYKPTLFQKIKLSIFTFHLKLIGKLDLYSLVNKLNDSLLIYFKLLNLLKR